MERNAILQIFLLINKPVKIVNHFITKENINKIFEENDMTGEIDLLSIDIDGNDYWIWKAINVVKPRVVVIEYNSAFGNKSITIKYDSNFRRSIKHKTSLYFGASLSALTKLAKEKGYILVGRCSEGVNAFFVRKDVVKRKFKEISPIETFYENEGMTKFGNPEKQFDSIKHLKFEKI